MNDTNSLRTTRSNTSLRVEQDNITLRSPNSNPSMRGGKGDAIDPNNASQQTFAEPLAQSLPQTPSEAERARKIYLTTIFGGTMMIIFIIFSVFSIYWGALFKTPTHTHNLVGWVVDFDHGAVGSAMTTAVQQLPFSKTSMTWIVKDASEFPGGPQDLANQVHEQHVWFVVSVNPGATDALNAAVASPEQHTDYDGSIAITGYGEEARSENGYRTVIRPQFEAMIQPLIANFSSQFVAQNISTLPEAQATAVLKNVPRLVNHPIYYQIVNLRPFDVPVATAVTFVGLIYLLILSFLVTVISHGATEASGYERNLPTGKLIALRFTTNITIYFFLSLFYCLVSLAFQAPFSRFMGKAGFVIYWMLQWIGMVALGLALETMTTLMTHKFVSIFLILWIIADVAVAFLPLELLPGVFRYGYAMPFYNISQAVRVIMFGTKNRLGLHFGVLFAWTGVSFVTLPLSTILVRRLRARAEAKAQVQLAAQQVDTEAIYKRANAH